MARLLRTSCSSRGNTIVKANKRRMFCVHRFKLEEFSRIKSKINTTLTLGFIELPDSPEDLHNTFMIIYSRYVMLLFLLHYL